MAFQSKSLLTDSFPGPLGEGRAASTAGGGTALTTASTAIPLFLGTTHLSVITRNYTTAVVVKLALNPYLLVLRTTNAGQTFTDSSSAAQNKTTGRNLVLDAQPASPNGALYIGSHLPFRGFVYTSNQANAAASVLSGNFWNGTAWTALAGFTDGTSAAGATFGQNGNVTWTVPTTWATTTIPDTLAPQNPSPVPGWLMQPGASIPVPPIMKLAMVPYSEKPRFWVQLLVTATLSATVSGSAMTSLNRDAATSWSEHVTGTKFEMRTFVGPDGVSALEAQTDAGTANLIVNCFSDQVQTAGQGVI